MVLPTKTNREFIPLKNDAWKTTFLLKMVPMFRVHVNFRGGKT